MGVSLGWRPRYKLLALSRVGLLAVLVAALGLGAAGVTLAYETQAWVYLFGMVALNLPHGGYEHFANLRRRELDFRWRYLGLYLTLVAGFVALFFLQPVVGLTLAIAVAVAKGGLGGVSVLDATTGTDHLRTRPQRLLAAAVRGGAVMAVPVFAWPSTFRMFSHYMVNIFQPGALSAVAPYFEVTRWLIGGGWALAALTHVGLGYVRGGGRSWLVDAGETVLLGAYFLVVPVVVAVGLYFPLWYSTRQVARSLAVDDHRPATGPDLLEFDRPEHVTLAAGASLLAGAVLTFLIAAALFRVAPQPLGGAPLAIGAVAFWSVFVSIIALPHVVVGSLLDREAGIWFTP
ncbi:MAG: Brp/Blh family beta-carotene 15,15'-dioxygenase [Haloarculaceae archaeon]